MALAGIMIGGVAGFFSFITAWLIAGTSFGAAVGIYFAAGSIVIALFAIVALARRFAPQPQAKADNTATA